MKMYKYLGIRMRDDGQMSTDLDHRKQTKISLRKKLWLIKSSNMGGVARIQLWQTLFKARWAYGHQLFSTVCSKFREWIKSCHYEGIKALIGIRRNPEKNATLKLAYDSKWECWQSVMNKKHFDKLRIRRDPMICKCTTEEAKVAHQTHEREDNQLPIKRYLNLHLTHLFKWQVKCIGTGWQSIIDTT